MGCQSIAGLPPALDSPVSIYTPGWREALWELRVLPKKTTQRPRPGLEPGPGNKGMAKRKRPRDVIDETTLKWAN